MKQSTLFKLILNENKRRIIEDQWNKFLETFFFYVIIDHMSHMIFWFWVFLRFCAFWPCALRGYSWLFYNISQYTHRRRHHFHTDIGNSIKCVKQLNYLMKTMDLLTHPPQNEHYLHHRKWALFKKVDSASQFINHVFLPLNLWKWFFRIKVELPSFKVCIIGFSLTPLGVFWVSFFRWPLVKESPRFFQNLRSLEL